MEREWAAPGKKISAQVRQLPQQDFEMLMEGLLSHKDGVLDTREMIGLAMGDGGVEMV